MSSSKSTVVTIMGTVTPSVVLKRGEKKTVALTPRIQRLIDRGFVTVIERHDVPVAPAKKVKPPVAPPASDFDLPKSVSFDDD